MAKFKGDIVIDIEKCKGCQVCIPACPNDVIAVSKNVNGKGYNYAEPVNEDDCIGCANCAVVCPDGVITVYRKRIE
ncbi:MAG: ferredoxin family protein [Lentimicrobiaceae bacterium]